ncbi:na+ driven multidrug efflux pump [Firmicutes bacterium CAG:449]|nr:na+ driven multidrug efflux pump [Firmicutes bacterium CAG:449]
MDLFAYCLRGIGYSITPMIITLCGACGLRIVWILTFFQMEEFHNIQGLVVSYPISWIITALVQVIFFIIVYRHLKFKED